MMLSSQITKPARPNVVSPSCSALQCYNIALPGIFFKYYTLSNFAIILYIIFRRFCQVFSIMFCLFCVKNDDNKCLSLVFCKIRPNSNIYIFKTIVIIFSFYLQKIFQ